MPAYGTGNGLAGTDQAMSSSFKTLLALTAQTSGLRRGAISEFSIGANAAPNATDCPVEFDVSRQTAAGTSTAATPVPLNPADVAATTVGAVDFTGEGTITAASALVAGSMNQRATYRWVASPGQELWWPATNLAGLAIRALSPTYTGTMRAHAIHIE